jgi:hypothetical protein
MFWIPGTDDSAITRASTTQWGAKSEQNGHKWPRTDCCHKRRNAGRGFAANDETKMSCDEIRLKQRQGRFFSSNGCPISPETPQPYLRTPPPPGGVFAFLAQGAPIRTMSARLGVRAVNITPTMKRDVGRKPDLVALPQPTGNLGPPGFKRQKAGRFPAVLFGLRQNLLAW